MENFSDFEFEHKNLAVKIFSDSCCNGCSCRSEKIHTTNASDVLSDQSFGISDTH